MNCGMICQNQGSLISSIADRTVKRKISSVTIILKGRLTEQREHFLPSTMFCQYIFTYLSLLDRDCSWKKPSVAQNAIANKHEQYPASTVLMGLMRMSAWVSIMMTSLREPLFNVFTVSWNNIFSIQRLWFRATTRLNWS